MDNLIVAQPTTHTHVNVELPGLTWQVITITAESTVELVTRYGGCNDYRALVVDARYYDLVMCKHIVGRPQIEAALNQALTMVQQAIASLAQPAAPPSAVPNDTPPTAPCPLGCGRLVLTEGGHVHYCVTKIQLGRRTETTREYVGTFDGEAVIYGDRSDDVERRLNTYIAELAIEGLNRTATELDGGANVGQFDYDNEPGAMLAILGPIADAPDLAGGWLCPCPCEPAANVCGPYALTCAGCGKAKREADFSRLEATDPIVLCDDCQAAAGARIKAAVLAQIAAEEAPARRVVAAGWGGSDLAIIAAQVLLPLAHLRPYVSNHGDYIGISTQIEMPVPCNEHAIVTSLIDALNAVAAQLPAAPSSISAHMHIGAQLYTVSHNGPPLASTATPDALPVEPPDLAAMIAAPAAPLSVNQCCLCNSDLRYPGAPCPRCGCGPCVLCRGDHTIARCPRVIAEQARLTSAARGIQRAIEADWARFALSVQHCNESDRQAMAECWAAEYGWQAEAVLGAWLSWIEKAAA